MSKAMVCEWDRIPRELDWVKLRAECTLDGMLKRLRDETLIDIKRREEFLREPDKTAIKFTLEDLDRAFAVHREGRGLDASVFFRIAANAITVLDARSNALLTAVVAINDAGRCIFRIGDSELETWQFRKRALENLFFWY